MIGLIVKFKLQEGKGKEFERIFARLAENVREHEPGNLLYKLGKSRTEPDTYVAMELYKDQAAIDAHRATPYMAAELAGFRACLAPEPPKAEFLDMIADGM